MYIARKLKETNLAEYLLYMWQTEDLIRANGCSVEQMERRVVNAYHDLSDGQHRALVQWYADLIDMMRQEGVTERGHLQICRNAVTWLTELHAALLASPKFPYYHAMYYKALPFIVELRAKGADKGNTDIETCLEALYGIMLLKLQKKAVGEETAKAQETVAALLAMLAHYYNENKKGKLDL